MISAPWTVVTVANKRMLKSGLEKSINYRNVRVVIRILFNFYPNICLDIKNFCSVCVDSYFVSSWSRVANFSANCQWIAINICKSGVGMTDCWIRMTVMKLSIKTKIKTVFKNDKKSCRSPFTYIIATLSKTQKNSILGERVWSTRTISKSII